MYPILLQFGNVVIPAWHTFYMLGALGTFFLLKYLSGRCTPPINGQHVSTLFVLGYFAGYFGARLLSIFVEELDVIGFVDVVAALFRLGPMTFYGGAIATFIAGTIYVKVKRLPFWDLLDAAIPAGLLALGIGRIGCFLNGDDFGIPVPLSDTESAPWWAVTFPNLKDDVARYPIQLIEAGVAFVIVYAAIVLFARMRRQLGRGIIGLACISAYGLSRFFLEFWRGDSRGWAIPDVLSTSQGISIIVLLGIAAMIPSWLKANNRASASH